MQGHTLTVSSPNYLPIETKGSLQIDTDFRNTVNTALHYILSRFCNNACIYILYTVFNFVSNVLKENLFKNCF